MTIQRSDNAAELIINRVSPLRLGDPGPSEDETDRMIAAGLRAPDHGALRPWKFFIVRGEARARFGALLGESLRRRQPEATADAVRIEAAKVMRAPLLIVAAATPRDTTKVPAVEQVLAAGAAVQNIIIAAHALGYGAFWRTGAAAYDPGLIKALGLAEADQIIGFVYVGSVVVPGKAKQPQPDDVVEVWTGAARHVT